MQDAKRGLRGQAGSLDIDDFNENILCFGQISCIARRGDLQQPFR
jgi:hypothetical protein